MAFIEIREAVMCDPVTKRFDLTAVIPWALTAITVIIGIWQFTSQQKQANRQLFLQKQLELCFKASEAASQLSSENNPEEWEKSRTTFWRLYWGPLSIVEDQAVKQAMITLGGLVPRQPVAAPSLPMTDLQAPSYTLALAVRNLLLKSWNIDLPALTDPKP